MAARPGPGKNIFKYASNWNTASGTMPCGRIIRHVCACGGAAHVWSHGNEIGPRYSSKLRLVDHNAEPEHVQHVQRHSANRQ